MRFGNKVDDIGPLPTVGSGPRADFWGKTPHANPDERIGLATTFAFLFHYFFVTRLDYDIAPFV